VGNVLFFGGVLAEVQSATSTSLVAIVPPLASGSGPIEIPGLSSACSVYSAQSFGVRAITGVLPVQGLPGTQITISGAFLGGTGALVQFDNGNATAALDPSSTDTTLVATIPQGAGNAGDLIVLAGTDTLTWPNYPVAANITMMCTCTSAGAGAMVGDTWQAAGTIHATGVTAGDTGASVFFAGFRGDLFTSVPGTLATVGANASLSASGPADPPYNTTDSVSLTGVVKPDGTGSGTGTMGTAAGTLGFSWTSVPR
jgi:hypothetical protein